jgi:hypothetical protein
MTSRRLLSAVLMLCVAIIACGGGGPTLPPTDTAAPRPTKTTRAPTEVVPTDQSPTQEPQPTNVPATRVPKATATSSGSSGSCSAFKATSNVAWVTLDSSGNVDQQVSSYPDGTTTITPVFEYDCVPKALTLVTIFSYNGQQVFSDKAQLKATHTKSAYGYPLGTKDGSPIQNGDWSVEFYNNKDLVAQGAVTVGGAANTNDNTNSNTNGNTNDNTNTNGNGNDNTAQTVTVQGTVTAKAGGKAIKGAVVVILQPGITVKQFVADKYKDADVFTAGQSDAKGQFTLKDPLQRNTTYSLLVVATGFKPVATDNFVIDNSVGDPVQLDVQLSQ